jgi:outer membrane immunogenic protein
MRRLVLATVMVVIAHGALAADMPDLPVLRGFVSEAPQGVRTNWDGYYVGGQFGLSVVDDDFTLATRSLTQSLLRDAIMSDIIPNWSLLSTSHANVTSFGGFVGRNWQWQDAVLGIEMNYNHFSGKTLFSSGSMSRAITNPNGSSPPTGHTYVYDMTLSGKAQATIHDVATLRARAGWDAGFALPYAFGGLAIGRIDASRSATLTGQRHDLWTETTTLTDSFGNTITVSTPHDDLTDASLGSQSQTRNNNIVFGWTVGAGAEVALLSNVFLRGEWEYVRFQTMMDIPIHMNTFRGGLGYKF